MRILIDATPLLLKSAGVKNYTYYWIQNLWQQARNERILTLPALGSLPALDHERSIAGPARTFFHLGRVFAANAVPSLPLLRWTMPRADVFHISNQIRFPPKGVKLTATIYDMTVRLMPELHTAANIQADENLAKECAGAGRSADRHFGKLEAGRGAAAGIGRRSNRGDLSGRARGLFRRASTAERAALRSVPGHHRAAQERGHVAGCVERLPLSRRFRFGDRGGRADGRRTRHWRAWRHGRLESAIVGYVPEDELPGLVAGASAFVYPSLYEGFGFPVAQAMAAGVPVITSNSSCLPEITAGGALLVDPQSAEEIRAAMEKLLTSPALQQELRTAGVARAQAEYRWEICARKSLEFFGRV